MHQKWNRWEKKHNNGRTRLTVSLVDGRFLVDVGFLRGWEQKQEDKREKNRDWEVKWISYHPTKCAVYICRLLNRKAESVSQAPVINCSVGDNLTNMQRGWLVQVSRTVTGESSRWQGNKKDKERDLKGTQEEYKREDGRSTWLFVALVRLSLLSKSFSVNNELD